MRGLVSALPPPSSLRLILLLTLPSLLFATPQETYLQRFQHFLEWNTHLPDQPNAKFLHFIHEDTPLGNKLRERWLYHLAEKKDWVTYLYYYKKSNQTGLNCYAEYAHYLQGQHASALNASRSLWLSGQSLPAACNLLFETMRHEENFDERFIDARIILALNENNSQLVTYLLKQYKVPKTHDINYLNQILRNPKSISELPIDNFHGYFYVFGLKKLIAQKKNPLPLWQLALNQHRLNDSQQQQFLSYLALYKALRNEDDAQMWFDKVRPAFYNDDLLDWQIRNALKQLNWPKVEQLINHLQDKRDPCWQYWLARSLEAQGKLSAARAIYQAIAKTRHYYGFLASQRLNQTFNFESDGSHINPGLIAPYQRITSQVIYLHQHQRQGEASQLLSDFSSELPKDEKISLIHWIGSSLSWYGKAISLCEGDDLKNQLALRFPLAHRETIKKMAQTYHVPEAFIYAVIRQESTFRSDIVSPAGARGLMQLMPTTAIQVARNNHIPYRHHNDLFQSNLNINLGTAYLDVLGRHFQNHPILMAAAYNAGPHQVLYWLKNHSPKEMDIWVETLPWKETRNYLKNVVAFYAVYQYQLQRKATLDAALQPIQ